MPSWCANHSGETPGAALVAGASSDIGAAISRMLASRGHSLHLWGRDEGRLQKLEHELIAAVPATSATFDVRDRAALRQAVDVVAADTAPPRVLVWAAGRFDWGPHGSADVDDIDDLVDVTLTSAMVTSRLLLPALLRNAPAHIVFIGSIAGKQAFANNAAYVAAKHGLRGFAEALHLEVSAAGGHVTTVSAGLTLAGSGLDAPEARARPESLLSADDIASAVAFALDAPDHARASEIVLRPR